MNTNTKKNPLTFIIVLLVVIAMIALAVWSFSNSSKTKSDLEFRKVSSGADKYVNAAQKTEQLIEAYQEDELFNSPFFMSLKAFLNLPLEIGQVGKPDPFSVPEVLEDLGEL
ncbi:hypothetical protein KKF32_03210 [Patescibacteria group bacterium]|nr:hypothetical protein [Patescibacteria group bacterium]